jgi:hypothetical protein
VEAGKPSTKPIVVEDITTELVAAAGKLLRILGKPDLPPFLYSHCFSHRAQLESVYRAFGEFDEAEIQKATAKL